MQESERNLRKTQIFTVNLEKPDKTKVGGILVFRNNHPNRRLNPKESIMNEGSLGLSVILGQLYKFLFFLFSLKETVVSPEFTQNMTNNKQLSTIMETTETNTISSTKSSVSSSPEVDYDTITSPKTASKNLPKTNLETITENSNELSIKKEISCLNITSPEIPTNKVYDTTCPSLCPVPDESVNVTKSFMKKPALLDTDEMMDFFTTTPEYKKNKFASSHKKVILNESKTYPNVNTETSFIPKKLITQNNVSVLPSFSDMPKFENTENLTEPILVKSHVKKNVSVLPSFSEMSIFEKTEPIVLNPSIVKKNTSFVLPSIKKRFGDVTKFESNTEEITESNFKMIQISGNSTKIQNLEESLLKPDDKQKARSFYQNSLAETEESYKFDFSLKKEQSISINDVLNSSHLKRKSILDSFREIKNASINEKVEDSSIDILIDDEDFDQDEFGKSIYIPKSPIENVKQLSDVWDELNSHSGTTTDSFYHPQVDLNETQQRLDLFVQAEYKNPFDTNLCDAFLEKVEFYTFLKDEVPSCTMINKVHPLKVNTIVKVGKESFEINKLIGEGAFGKVYM